MVENKFVHQKREREFQQRVLAAVEKPKSSKLVAVLNSAFFLWVLTACVVTAGGTYVGAYQQCRKDADSEIDRSTKLERELYQRELNIRNIILAKAHVADMRQALAQPNSYYPEFSGFPTQIIRENYASFLNRVTDLKLGPDAQVPVPAMFLKLMVINQGVIPDNITDKDIPELREYAQKMLAAASVIPLPGFGLSRFEPSCGFWTLVNRFFSGNEVDVVRSATRKPALPKVLPLPPPG